MSNASMSGFVATIFIAFIELSCSGDNANAGSHTDGSTDATGGTDAAQGDAAQNAAASDVVDAGPSDSVYEIDRAHLADAAIDNPLDYGDPNLWVCRPGIDPNPCYGNNGELDSTEVLPDGSLRLVRHHHAQDPKFDCFYVYPTVYLVGDGGNQTDLSNVDNVLDALMAQGARMSRICEVYAPLYRQVAISPNLVMAGAMMGSADAGVTDAAPDATSAAVANATPDATSAAGGSSDASPGNGPLAGPGFMHAAADVNAAFKYYLDHFNKGRKFVLMGHSQGSGMLINVIQNQIDNDATMRAQMISALIIGGGVTVAAGQTSGGSFKNVPTCTQPDQTGCVVAYSSFDTNGPDSTSLFGRSQGGQDVACTNPAPLAGNLGPYRGSYFSLRINNPAFRLNSTPTVGDDAGAAFLLYRDVFTGRCVGKNGANYLEIASLIADAGDPRGRPPYGSLPGFGLHVYDWHFPMDDLIDLVTQQAAVALP
jgi:hypothetical protein